MTTISTRSTLSASLARTKGGCATEAHHSKEHRRSQRLRRDDDDDGVAVHGDVDEFEDEEIDSVEADGIAEAPSDDGDVAKRELTAALVSSIVESAASAVGGKLGNDKNKPNGDGKSNGDDNATNELGKRKSLAGDEQEVQKNAVVSKLPCEDAQHVTPPASASSSFSSIEATDTCQAAPNQQTKPTSPSGGRTMYQRASKSVATEKVSSTLAPAPKPNPQALNAKAAQNAAHGSSSTIPEAKKRRLDTELKTTSNPIQPAQGTALVNGCSVAPAPPATRTKAGNKQSKSPKTLTAQAKAAQGMVPLRPLAPIYAGGMKPVPNPLAGKEDTPARAAPVNPNASTPNTSNKKSSNQSAVTKKTKTLMSAAPNAVVPSSGLPSRSLSVTQLDTVVPAQPQQVESAVDINLPARGRIFSMDLDPSVLDFVGSVVDDHNNDKNVSFKGDVADNAMSSSFRRDRGFSFEFFSFGIDANEDLPPIPDSLVGSVPSGNGNRLRGDSIIFDPTSFCDGGIHEESALMHTTTKQELSADPVLSQPVPLMAPSSAQPGPTAKPIKPTSSGRRPKPSFKLAAAAEPTRPVVGQGTAAPSAQVKQTTRGAKLSHSPIKYTKTTSKGGASRTVSASRPFPQALTENTIHMPHGSDAAAAAAAGLPESADASQGDGFSLSHTACPMDLLNKGGRIGIYLPEERKARIAKFHSKRRSRIWRKRIKYDCRKKLADSRPRIKGRFVKRSDVDGEDSP